MDNPKSNRSILPRCGLYEEEDGTCLPCGKSGHNLFAGEQELTHKRPPLDHSQLAAGFSTLKVLGSQVTAVCRMFPFLCVWGV